MKAPKRGSLASLSSGDDGELMYFDLSEPDTGAIFWSEDNGYILSVPQDDDMPKPLYLLSICFLRLCHDPEFADELTSWSKRKTH